MVVLFLSYGLARCVVALWVVMGSSRGCVIVVLWLWWGFAGGGGYDCAIDVL